MVETFSSNAEMLLDLALRHERVMFRYALHRTGVWEDAQDIVSETIARVWQKSSQWRSDKGAAWAWIYKICQNICVDHARSKAHRICTIPLEEAVADVDHIWLSCHDRDPAPLPDENAERTELLERIEHAVNRLSDTYRKVAILNLFEGKSYAEVCELIGGIYSTNKIHMYRARKILRNNPRLQESAEAFGVRAAKSETRKRRARSAVRELPSRESVSEQASNATSATLDALLRKGCGSP